MNSNSPAKIVTAPPGYLDEGLFGRVFLWILDILPYLDRHKIFPAWAIPSALYGVGERQIIIPGALDLAYAPPPGPYQDLSLVDLRNRHCNRFGADWNEISQLWKSYFAIPPRVEAAVQKIPLGPSVLGIHFRGTDKAKASWDSNPVTSDDMIALTLDYLRRNPRFTSIFVATDEPDFITDLRASVDMNVQSFGAGQHHKPDTGPKHDDYEQADRAVADCVALSQCGAVLLTSSALSAFAKILTPGLEIYRCAASKMLWDGPYYPVAYIPCYTTDDPACAAILARTMTGDWLTAPNAGRFTRPFATRPNYRWRYSALKRRIKRPIKKLLGRDTEKPLHFFHR